MRKHQLLIAFIYSLFCLSCSQRPDTDKLSGGVSPLFIEKSLSPEIAETSGLACLADGSFFTVNDSGNPATLFQLDKSGRVIGRTATTGVNQDWEALAIHQGQLWIGDIGNNSGQRSTIELYHAPLPAKPFENLTLSKIILRYPHPPMGLPSHFQHELDAEALVSTGEQLLLFTKNWVGLQSAVYLVDTSQTNTVLKQIGETSALPGLITDAAYSFKHNVFVIVGYGNFRLNPLSFMFSGEFAPFLAVLDRDYRLIKSVPIPSGGQLEALCIDNEQNIWLSQEKSSRQPAQFWRWGFVESLLKPTD
ncbi:MAG: hypothetical protein E6Q75_02685 [Rheinheimera sp.]|nr:MAG: hypothetical protein E6Q75_02685 [Rheinheimera sp.]